MRLIRIHKILILTIAALFASLFSINCFNSKISTHARLNPGDRFICVLQNIGFKELKNTKFRIAVVDPDESKLTTDDLKDLHKEDKILLAYLSIGEAESYRDYWQDDWKVGSPNFIGIENPNWDGNFKVQYWNKEWQEIIFNKLNQIIDLGYDGVYLDVVDAYKYYENNGVNFAREKMIDFVRNISEKSKEKNNHFLILPQNAEELVSYEDYLSVIDGIGREDLWYIDDNLQDEEELNTALCHLQKIINARKLVLVISYPAEKDNKCNFIKIARKHNFIPYVGKRELDTIETVNCN